MLMGGTLVNAAAVVCGGLIGLLLKKGMKPSLEQAVHKALGVAVVILGLNGVISSMFTVAANGALSSSGELLLIVSLVAGTLVGELLQIDARLMRFSQKIERKVGAEGFAAAFVNGTLLFCVGAMTVVGAINDGLHHDPGVLYVKSMLDCISSIVFGATLGVGVCFAAIPLLLYQGGLTLAAGLVAPYLQGALLGQICMVGYAMVACIGINFLTSAPRIKTANLLPALLVPVLWAVVQNFI